MDGSCGFGCLSTVLNDLGFVVMAWVVTVGEVVEVEAKVDMLGLLCLPCVFQTFCEDNARNYCE